MITVFTLIEFGLCYLTHAKLLCGKHLTIQAMCLVIDVILVFIGFGTFRFIPLIMDIVVQGVCYLIAKRYFSNIIEYYRNADKNHDAMEDLSKNLRDF